VNRYDWSGSPRLDALMHELGASLRREVDLGESPATVAPSAKSEPIPTLEVFR
jgi:hypothetical protein